MFIFDLMIRPVEEKDHQEITSIYNYYIIHSIATFEEELISVNEMSGRIDKIIKDFPWLVYESDQNILGYAYAGLWNKRSAYKHSAEITVYVKHSARSAGIGTSLYDLLIKHLKSSGFHAIIGGISLPNEASIALHEKFGMTKVAHFKAVGFKFDKWIDVGYWELVFK